MASLNFTTTGSHMTNMIFDFIKSGLYYNAIEILKSGGFDSNRCRLFFMGKYEFEGNTKLGGDLNVVEKEGMSTNELIELLVVGLRTLLQENYEDKLYLQDLFHWRFRDNKENEPMFKHLDSLYEVFPKDVLKSMLMNKMVVEAGFDFREGIGPNFDGVILPDGRIIECGMQQHNELYPFLYIMGFSSASCWTDDDKTIHISSGQMSGKLAHKIEEWEDYKESDKGDVTGSIMKTIIANHKNLSIYGRSSNMMQRIMKFYEADAEMGGKFGKLTFLKNCYPEINLPLFSKEEIKDVKNCIRTSPKMSIPGLLNSKFDINENSIKEIEADFEKYKNVVGYQKFMDGSYRTTNKLHYFYQEYLEGINGVAHCRNKVFTYDCSETRGDIVDGKKGTIKLEFEPEYELKMILEKLHKDLGKDIQVEFVVSNNKLYIVQLRTLENSWNDFSTTVDKEKIIVSGKSFSMDVESNLTKDDILIIDDDCESEMVIGKKALIVRNDTEFSHALALSFALKIPSIYAVGNDFELPDVFQINTKGRKGYILKQ